MLGEVTGSDGKVLQRAEVSGGAWNKLPRPSQIVFYLKY